MSFPQYERYKESGVEWLGDVPEHWGVKRLKYQSTINDETLPETTNPDYELLYVDISSVDPSQGIIQKEALLFENAPSRARRIVKNGDTIISTVRTYLRAISPVIEPENNLIVSTGFAVIRPREVNQEYLSAVIRAPYFIEEVVSRSVGVSYPAINASEIGFISIPLPPLPEQQAIAAFLDRETSRIDSLIGKKKKLVELLAEQRTALISRAVTKGLDAGVKLKPSGVEWLGEVPEHWEVKALRYICTIETGDKDTVNAEDDGEYQFFVRSQTVERISTFTKNCEAVLTAGDGVGVGKVFHYVNGKFDFHQRVYMFSNFRKVTGRFFFQFLKENFWRVALEGGAKSTVDSLRRPMISSFPFIIPPLPEQQAIAAFLDRETARIDTLVSKVEKAIDTLQEYRTALISAAVTGKIDVREK